MNKNYTIKHKENVISLMRKGLDAVLNDEAISYWAHITRVVSYTEDESGKIVLKNAGENEYCIYFRVIEDE